jgi:uncharacterized protein (TIRG00374 family)
MKLLKDWKLWLGLVISAGSLYLALRGLNLPSLWDAVRTAQYWWILPGVVVYFFAVWARTWRWHYMLRQLKHIPLGRLFPVVCIGYMGNNVYPARAGEFIRSYVLKRKENVSFSSSLATAFVERVFDGVVMLIFVFFSLPFTPMPDWLRNIVIIGSVAFFGVLIVFFIFAVRPAWAQRIYTPLINRFVPERFRVPLIGFLDRFMEGLKSLRHARDVLMIFVTSLVIWLAETVKYWFVMHAFSFSVPFYVLMLMNGVVNLATTIPSSPGYVGTFDLPGIKILQNYGVVATTAAAYTLVLHGALWFPITIVGAFYMWRERVTWRDFGAAAADKRAGAPAAERSDAVSG